MRMVHLSDIHYSPNNKEKFERAILKPLLRDLEEFHIIKKIDLICFTGDLLDKGGFSKGSKKGTEEVFLNFQEDVIDPILKMLSLDLKNFLFIPGNHDINRNKIADVIENGLNVVLNTPEIIESYMENRQDQLNLERIEEYKSFEDYYYNDVSEYHQNKFGYTMLLQINDIKVGIGGINSSWRCSDQDENKIIVGRYQLDLIKNEFSKYKPDFKIGLMHHPFDFISSLEREQIKQDMISEFDIIMVGHTHTGSADSTTRSVGDTVLYQILPQIGLTICY